MRGRGKLSPAAARFRRREPVAEPLPCPLTTTLPKGGPKLTIPVRGPLEVTYHTITDEQILELRSGLFPSHYMHQWTIDAFDTTHPQRRKNARRECAEYLNAQSAKLRALVK